MSNDIIYRISGIVDGTSVDGPGLRTSIYFSGCRHQCPGCHNPHTWDFDAGAEMTGAELLERIAANGMNVTFSGGDPVYIAPLLVPLARDIRRLGLGIWMYTGFVYEELVQMGGEVEQLLGLVDVLVDGPFVQAERDLSLLFRGSRNQRLVDIAATRRNAAITLYQPDF